MKKISSLPAHKIIIWICMTPALIFIFLYELLLSNIPACSVTVFKLGQIFSKISYSIAAASIFYLVSQYIGIFIPKQKRKIRVLQIVFSNTVTIDNVISGLKLNLAYEWGDIKDSEKFKAILANIDTDKPIRNFPNWYEYLGYLKFQLLDLIRGITFYHDMLDTDFFHELLIIEERLMSPVTFSGYKVLAVSDLTHAEIDLQELMIHNDHLQQLREREFKKHKKLLEKSGRKYREIYFSDLSKS